MNERHGGVPSVAAVGRALARLSPGAFRAFVADCWATRGFETTGEGPVVRVRRAGVSRTLLVVHETGPLGSVPTPPDGTPVDVVVAADAGVAERVAAAHGAHAHGPAAVRGALLHALDRDDADALCRRHLGRPLSAVGRRRWPATALPRALSTRTASAVCVLALALVAVGVAPLLAGGASGPAPATAADPHPAVDLGGAETAALVADTGAANRVDGRMLARVHRRSLAGQAHTVRVEVAETADGLDRDPTTEQLTWRAWVTADGRYRYRLAGAREVANGRLRSVSETRTGSRRAGVGGSSGADRFAARTARYVHRHLDSARVTGSVRREGTTLYRLERTASPTGPALPVSNYSASALVGVDGVVRQLVVSYAVETGGGPAPVTVRVEYDLRRPGTVRVDDTGTATGPT